MGSTPSNSIFDPLRAALTDQDVKIYREHVQNTDLRMAAADPWNQDQTRTDLARTLNREPN